MVAAEVRAGNSATELREIFFGTPMRICEISHFPETQDVVESFMNLNRTTDEYQDEVEKGDRTIFPNAVSNANL
jgi:hypothetical protein